MIHDYFWRWLAPALEQNGVDGNMERDVIRVTPISGPHFHRNLKRFASGVKKLKEAWIKYKGSEMRMRRFISQMPATRGSWR
ncbi:hypothetical protein [Corallococcus sp. 4LFB]|uniref:hypothetical protein n=1 Tax=Corallococcus sp. 4LFB TaxID=3383249 RepID=UPI0039768E07